MFGPSKSKKQPVQTPIGDGVSEISDGRSRHAINVTYALQ